MSVQRESRNESYDVVVIGSGVGGLAVASFLARAGKSVLVVERHDRPGGYAHGFQRKKYKFDSAVHMSSGCEELSFGFGALFHELLLILGTRDQAQFLTMDPFYTAVYPDLHFNAPGGVLEFADAHAQLFPKEARGIKEFLRLCTKLNMEAFHIPGDASSYDTLRQPDRFPLYHRYRCATLQQVLDHYLAEPRLKTLVATLWGYLGLPPSQMSILKFSSMLMSYLSTGVHYCQGTFQNLVNAIVAGIERYNGEILLRTRVRRIVTEGGRATGVILENGQRISASIVVSNADARQTFEELLGVEHLPSDYVTSLRAMRPSLSMAAIYMATDLPVEQLAGVGHATFISNSWDHDATYRGLLAGRPDNMMLNIPTLVDPTLAPPGEHLVTAMALVPFKLMQSWRSGKEEMVERMLNQVEAVLPGLRQHLTFVEGATPRTMERFTLNHVGAVYGWEASPEQAGIDRLGHVTPVDGLYLSSHWTQPGGGVGSVAASGAQTAQVILGYPNVPAMIQDMLTWQH